MFNDNHQTASRPKTGTSRPNMGQTNGPRKFTPKGHDARLQKLQDEKATTVIGLIDGSAVSGQIRGRDRYTITLYDTEAGVEVTFYKHAILSFHQEK